MKSSGRGTGTERRQWNPGESRRCVYLQRTARGSVRGEQREGENSEGVNEMRTEGRSMDQEQRVTDTALRRPLWTNATNSPETHMSVKSCGAAELLEKPRKGPLSPTAERQSSVCRADGGKKGGSQPSGTIARGRYQRGSVESFFRRTDTSECS